MFNVPTETKQKFDGRILFGIAAVVALLFELLVVQALHIGLGFFIFMMSTALVVTGYLIHQRMAHQPWAFVFLIPMAILSFDTVLYAHVLAVYVAPVLSVLLLILFIIVFTLKNPQEHVFRFRHIPVLKNVLSITEHISTVHKDFFRRNGPINSTYRKVAIGLIISFPILVVFAFLFSSADMVFAEGIKQMFDFSINPFMVNTIIRVAIISAVVGLFFYEVVHERHVLGEGEPKVKIFDHVIVTTILTLLNILFLTFVFIQLQYLFGNDAFVQANNIVYSEYAVSGFNQLAWIIGLAAALLAFLYRGTTTGKGKKMTKILKIILIAQVGIIALSALKRMNLYQDAYGLTLKRYFVEWFIYTVSALLLFGAGSIMKSLSFRKLFLGSLIVVLTSVTIVTSLNIDGKIARENMDRYMYEGKELDGEYLLYQLSKDVLPEFQRAVDAGYDYSPMHDTSFNNKSARMLSLKTNMRKLLSTQEVSDWRSFKFTDYRNSQITLKSMKVE